MKAAAIFLMVFAVVSVSALLIDNMVFRANFRRNLAETIEELLPAMDEQYEDSLQAFLHSIEGARSALGRLEQESGDLESIEQTLAEIEVRLRERIDYLASGGDSYAASLKKVWSE